MKDISQNIGTPQEITLFDNHSAKTGTSLDFTSFLENVQRGAWHRWVSRCREAYDKGGPSYNQSREDLPAVSVSGKMGCRKARATWEEQSFVHSGLIQVDLDGKHHPDLTLAEMKQRLGDFAFIVAAFTSVSGRGMKAIAVCPPADNKKMHTASFEIIARKLNKSGLTMDPNTKDSTRLCYVSSDPDLYHNPHAVPIDISEIEAEMENQPDAPEIASVGTKNLEGSGVCPDHAGNILQQIYDLQDTPDRETWLKIASATFGGVGVHTGAELMDEFFPHENDTVESYKALARSLPSFAPWESLRAFGVNPDDPKSFLDMLPDLGGEDVHQSEVRASMRERLLAEMEKRKFDFHHVPEKPIPIFKLGEHSICTAGNLTNVQGPIKSGKSAVVTAMLTSAIQGEGGTGDCLGFSADNCNQFALIHLDTEQSSYDFDKSVRRSLKRAEVGSKPDWFLSYGVKGLSAVDQFEILKLALERGRERFGGIFAVIIDGVADLCPALNNDEIAFGLVRDLLELAAIYKTTIITVLHENPGSESGKTRGHLGSELERKTETNLRISKGPDGVSTIYGTGSRNSSIPKDQGFCFQWDDATKAHVSCGRPRQRKAEAKRTKDKDEAEIVYGENPPRGGFAHGELKDRIVSLLGCGDSTAKRRIETWKNVGLIVQDGKTYHLRNGEEGV